MRPGESLPDVISWLDPEMSATPYGRQHDAAFPLLRPPGAIAEPDFLAACTRCGDCARACPHDAIVEAPERLRAAHGTPIIEPMAAPCQMCEELPCLAACETGALRPEAPAALGTALVQPLDCLNRLSSTCSVCVEHCPVPGAIALTDGVPQVVEPLCTGCGICQHVCPAPGNAIAMLPNLSRPTPAVLSARSSAAYTVSDNAVASTVSDNAAAYTVSDDAVAYTVADGSVASTVSDGSAVSTVSNAAVADTAPDAVEEKPEEIELPELREAELDAAGLRALFGDLEIAASIDGVKLKVAPGVRAQDDVVTPGAALALLLAGSVRGAQVRYRYAEQRWCDTILASAGGYRVVRMADPVRPA